ncbi:MAG: hypothetical protein K1X70_09680 [Leptospirales bacterium]|nr:hypothetical protein [Leptospirales bacterium]
MNAIGILKKHARPATLLSREPVGEPLLADLRQQRRFNSIVYGILFGVVLLLTVIVLAALSTDLVGAKSSREAILAGYGISLPLSLEWLRRVVREWTTLNLLITLVSHSDENAIQELIRKILAGKTIR